MQLTKNICTQMLRPVLARGCRYRLSMGRTKDYRYRLSVAAGRSIRSVIFWLCFIDCRPNASPLQMLIKQAFLLPNLVLYPALHKRHIDELVWQLNQSNLFGDLRQYLHHYRHESIHKIGLNRANVGQFETL